MVRTAAVCGRRRSVRVRVVAGAATVAIAMAAALSLGHALRGGQQGFDAGQRVQMKALFEEFDGSVVLGLFECTGADRFAFFRLFFVHLHGDTIVLL
jgi:ribonuclease BN (tRNA processing enzyme)